MPLTRILLAAPFEKLILHFRHKRLKNMRKHSGVITKLAASTLFINSHKQFITRQNRPGTLARESFFLIKFKQSEMKTSD